MINLAPIKYRFFFNDNKIIKDISCYTIKLFNNDEYFESLVTLHENLRPKEIAVSDIYSKADGGGTSKYKNEAIYKAISEGLERWAFYESSNDPSSVKYKFNENPTTCGMAAYPEPFCFNVKFKSELEALERFAIKKFWDSKLPLVKIENADSNHDIYKIITGNNNIIVILLHSFIDGVHYYSFAADYHIDKAIFHAEVELARNIRVMKKIKAGFDISMFNDIGDRRLLYFSTDEGYSLFLEKIKKAPRKILEEPLKIFDGEIKGEWSSYTKVWRVLYAACYYDNSTDHTFFMF